ncbi:unnamed protein product, partial [Rotaria sordida]
AIQRTLTLHALLGFYATSLNFNEAAEAQVISKI